MDNYTKAVGARIKEARLNLCWSRDFLAELAGCSISMIGLYERGTHLPSTRRIVAIASALGTTTDYLLTGKSEDV
jgi:transcriptional regulator with XRE-family HTH domain